MKSWIAKKFSKEDSSKITHDGSINFLGNYESWELARRDSRGYDSEKIFSQVLASTRQARLDPNLTEQDGFLLIKPNYSWPLLSFLFWIAAQKQGRLQVVDFGGALGTTYFQLRKFLPSLPLCRWGVVEQDQIVQAGSEFTTDSLSFHSTVKSAQKKLNAEVLICSGTLQYLPDPKTILNEILEEGFEYLIFDRTPFIGQTENRISVQSYKSGGEVMSYPLWLFSNDFLTSHFQGRYIEIENFDSKIDDVHQAFDGLEIRFRGQVFRKV